MIVLLDTSTPVCRLTLYIGAEKLTYDWDAGRSLAKGLLGYLEECLKKHGKTWADISGIGVFKGPGSFTGLRIGITVMNTLAQGLKQPIVGATGDDWIDVSISRLEKGDNDQIVLPEYGAEAHITTPRK